MAIAEVSTKWVDGEIVVYPDSDGEPMSDNTLQFEWIMLLKENLETLFQDNPDVFVAGDLLWYPVKGDNTSRMAPDALVAFGRPKGYRGSYEQWEEGGVAPQVAFEVLSPGNRAGKMQEKFEFYEKFGVEEYYLLDPEPNRRRPFRFEGWRRDGLGILQTIPTLHNYVSPRLGVRFETSGSVLAIYRPDGERFKKPGELFVERNQALTERNTALTERNAALDREREASARAARLAERLKALGIDPDVE